jgi:hypothetical protein
MSVSDGQQADVFEAEVDLVQRALELGERPGLMHPGVDQDDPGARRDRPCVAVRNARPRQRQTKPPQPREHTLATSKFTSGAHRTDDIAAA